MSLNSVFILIINYYYMKKNILSLKSLLFGLLILLGAYQQVKAQVYLLENFDSTFVGVPGAPPGWTQTRFDYWGNGTPTAINIAGPKDWQRNRLVSTGIWSSQSFGTIPAAAVTDSGALWLEDYNFGTQTNMLSRRLESPTVNLATSTSPYLRFNMFFAQNSNYTYPIIVMASNDNGATWKSIMHVQPNADVVTTTTTGAGTMNASTPWSKITVKIPDAYKVANAKFAFYRNNPYSFSSNPFIDSLTIEEFTPTTITSAQSGNWSNPTTWVGGIVPTANNHVVIDSTHTVTSNVNISRMQDLTINGGTFIYFSTATNTVSQIFGNLTISGGGTFNLGTSTSTSVSRWLYVGGNINNYGILNMGTSTAATLYLTGGASSVFSNNGTITNNYISSIYFANSSGTVFDATMTNNVVIRNSLFLIDGPVAPNGKLVVGITANTMTITRGCERAFFTQRPIYPALGTALRSVTYGGGTNGNPTMGIFYKDTIFVGNETDTLSTGVHFIRGTFTMFTQNHVKLRNPLQIGDTVGRTTLLTATNAGGATTFSRGILFTDDVNILTVGPIGNGSAGIAPSLNTVTPPTSHGSYVIGPIRFVRPLAGTLTSTFSVPLGYGAEYLQLSNPNNTRRYMQITAGGGWAGQIITARALTNPSGTVNAPQSSLLTNKLYRLSLQPGQNLPATSTVLISTSEEAGGVINRDVLLGNQDQLFIMQSTSPTGPWTARSLIAGAGAFVPNAIYTRTTAATAPGPVSGNGEFFAWGTTAPFMNFQNGDVSRETAPVSIGAQDMAMLRVRVNVNGQIPTRVTRLNFNTTGTTRLAAISSAKIYYTGNSNSFSTTTQFGSTITAPSGNIALTGDQVLVNGDNYFWIAYNVASGALIGDSLRANLDSIVVFDTARVLVTTPTAGFRVVSTPMTFVSANAEQLNLSKVEVGAPNAEILRLAVTMSATGAPIPASSFALTTDGSANPSGNIANARVYYTGSNPNFSTASLIGTTLNPNGAFAISGSQNLANGVNYFWLSYGIRTTATIGDSVDGTWDSVTVGGISRIVTNNNPSGSRLIRAAYCPSAATSTADEEIWNVTIGSLNNTSNCATLAPGPGSVNSFYSNYSGFLAAPNIAAGVNTPFSVNAASCGGNFTSRVAIFIDYNQNGIFDLPGEEAHLSPTFTSSTIGAAIRTGTINIPCSATPGLTRMRVVLVETTGAINPCGTYTWGETEDYDINIVNQNPVYLSSTTVQQTGTTSAGATDVRILRIPVVTSASPCIPGTANEFRFRTNGTTSAANIATAKLYYTGSSSVFNINKLSGSAISPAGNFTITTADTLINDTNYYWLAYDVSLTAPNANVLDAIFDSVLVYGNWQLPVVSNPTGNVLISSPMTYVGSSTIHPDLGMVERPSSNNRMLRIMVRMSSAGAPVSLTQINLDANGGGDDTSNIENVKIFATGSNPNFSIANQFGSTFVQTTPTANKYGAFNITGLQTLLNDTNYFWVTYNIKATAILFDSVDVECTGLTIAGTPQIPSVTAPAGNRKIRAVYCASNATSAADEEIWNVTIGTLNNTSNCTTLAPGANSAVSLYSNYSGFVAAPNLPAGVNIPFSVNAASCGGNFTSRVAIFIDYNQNGTFDLPGEQAYITPTSFVSSNAGTAIQTGSINIPCTATPGVTRMRVILVETIGAITPCGTYTWGETEDYDINIVNSAPVYNASNTLQQTGTTSAGATDVRILRIPIKVSSSACTPGTVTQFNFRTTGTTAVANILDAKLYSTGSSNVFNTSKLVGSASTPSGNFSITTNDTLINDTNNYWLTYDVSLTAANNNVLDAIFDSAQVYTNWVQPIVANPAGNVLISSPVTYVSSSAAHMELSMVETNSTNNRMLRVMVRMSSAGAPVSATQINLDAAGGGNDTSNIANAKVFFTGNSSVFATTNQFGSTFVQTTPTGASWGTFNITGLATLNPDTNYFWVTYDIKNTAVLGDSVDLACTGITVAGVNQTPSVTSPAGNRKIRQPYCATGAQFTGDGELLNVTLSTLNNTTTCTSVATGPGSALSLYNNYSESVTAPQINAGERVTYSVHTATCNGNYNGVMGIWIDLNQDGDFTDAGETVVMTPSFLYGNGIFQTGSFYLPLNALPGRTRMRVTLNETTASPITPCGLYFYGETEDYTIEILPTTNASYVWNQTAGGNFATPANWTPNRNKLNLSDRININTGNAATFTGVISESVMMLNLSNNTQATVANAGVDFVVTDSVTFGNSARLNINLLTLGVDTIKTGSISVGTNAGVIGSIKRWFNTSSGNISFPLINAAGVTRNLTVTYSILPSVIGSIIGTFNGNVGGNSGLPLYDSTAFLTVNKAGINGFWMLTPANGTVGGTYDVSLNATGFAGVNSYTNLVALRRVDASSPWTSVGVHATATGSNAAPVVNRTSVNVYGNFTIGGDSITNPLPVELLSFNGNQVNGDAQLSWTTSSETNNKGFTLERSINNADFKAVTFVKGAGNSKTIRNYAYTDLQPFSASNVLYYRLAQEDFDGTIAYSNTVSVSISEVIEESVAVYPNPFTEGTGVFITSANDANVKIEIVDILGRTIATQTSAIVAGSQYVNLTGLNQLTSGVYIVRLTNGNVVTTVKVQKVD
jgi:hypothetical protein